MGVAESSALFEEAKHITGSVGSPIRVSLYDSIYNERIAQAYGGLEEAVEYGHLLLQCLGPSPDVPAGTRAVIEVLVHGEMLLLFSKVLERADSGQLLVTWPYETNRQQRRRSPRVDVSAPVYYTLQGSTAPHLGELENVSTGGVSFFCADPVAVGEELVMAFGMGSGCYFQEIRATVLRCNPSMQNRFRVAARFDGLDSDVQVHLSQWVRSRRRADEDADFTEHF